MAPLANSSSTSILIMEWWAGVAFMLNHLKLQNNGGQPLSWWWWPFIILSTNTRSNAFPLIQEFRKGANQHNRWRSWWWRLWHIVNDWHQCLSFFLESVVLVDTPPTALLLPPWWPSGLGSMLGFFGNEAPPDSGRAYFWTLNQNNFWLASGTPNREWRLGQSKVGCVVSLCQG